MSDLRYDAPATAEAAIALLTGAGGVTRILNGGTDVLVQLHADMIDPEMVVDIKKIPGLNSISREAGGWRVGATATGMELMDHAGFRKAWPGIVDGVSLIGELEGCYALSGAGVATEDIVQIGGVDHLVVPNVFRTTRYDFFAVRLG